MKDITSTTFGLIIAYLLPGLTGLIALSFWCKPIQGYLKIFLSADSSVGLFLIIILFAIVISLEVSVVRWLIFEVLLCRHHGLPKTYFANLNTKDTLEAFRAAVDEHYRYHQFWGGMAVVMPFLFYGACKDAKFAPYVESKLSLAFFLLIEFLTVVAGIVSYIFYTRRSKIILSGGQNNAKRMGSQAKNDQEEGKEKSSQEESSKEEESSQEEKEEESSQEEKEEEIGTL